MPETAPEPAAPKQLAEEPADAGVVEATAAPSPQNPARVERPRDRPTAPAALELPRGPRPRTAGTGRRRPANPAAGAATERQPEQAQVELELEPIEIPRPRVVRSGAAAAWPGRRDVVPAINEQAHVADSDVAELEPELATDTAPIAVLGGTLDREPRPDVRRDGPLARRLTADAARERSDPVNARERCGPVCRRRRHLGRFWHGDWPAIGRLACQNRGRGRSVALERA